jgi:hypothetical protein
MSTQMAYLREGLFDKFYSYANTIFEEIIITRIAQITLPPVNQVGF